MRTSEKKKKEKQNSNNDGKNLNKLFIFHIFCSSSEIIPPFGIAIAIFVSLIYHERTPQNYYDYDDLLLL